MKNAIFNGTYTEIFKTITGAALFALWFGTMLVCALAYFDCLTR
jgi:hypothetical protein